MGSTSATRELRVRQITWEAAGVISVGLTPADEADLPTYEPGAHIDLFLTPDLVRQYSLCGDPRGRDEWRIAVLRESQSRGGSAFVHDALRPGMSVQARGPRNNFPLVDAQRYLFIAGGIGVTPLLPMIAQVDRQRRDWALLYGARRRASMAFRDELEEYGSRVTLAPHDECGPLELHSAVGAFDPEGAVYCCGPEALIVAVEQTCANLGRNAPHVERFGAREAAPTDARGGRDTPFDVVLAGSDTRVRIPVGRSIVEMLDEAGISIPTSCGEGFCGTCETHVVGGIPDHRDDYFTDAERATNKTMMVCVGRSLTPVLTLKV